MIKKVSILIALIVIFLILGIEGGISFLSNHAYYTGMLNMQNLGLIFAALVAGIVPFAYLYLSDEPKLLPLLSWTGAGLGTFAIFHASIKSYLIDGFAPFSLLFNVLLFFSLACGIFFLIRNLGHFLTRKANIFRNISMVNLLLTFGLGLIVFLVVMQFLIGFGLFYSRLVRAIVLALAGLSYFERKKQAEIQTYLTSFLKIAKSSLQNPLSRVLFVLILLSLVYFFFGFLHSYIPYPTAWDANHEYMYIPKVIMENAGVLRANQGAASSMPYLWHSFIAFAFSFRKPISIILPIASDTFAVNMNFWSGVFVLIYGLAALWQSISLFASLKNSNREEISDQYQLPFLLGWGLLLLWLTSGMGAFLLFVDNKTDMGVLLIAIMGLLAGLAWIKKIMIEKADQHTLIYLLTSAFFFAFAVMAKPTAFIDVVMFGLLLLGLWLNVGVALGAGLIVLGIMGILQPLNAAAFMSPALGKIIIAIGILIFAGSLCFSIVKKVVKKSDFKTSFFLPLKNILLRGVVFCMTMLLFKTPWYTYGKYAAGKELSLPEILKSTLLGYAPTSSIEQKKPFHNLLLAQAVSVSDLDSQNQIDSAYENQRLGQLDLAQCQAEELSTEELEKDKKKAPGGALLEDFGRYVGFGARPFSKTGVAGKILNMLFWKENACYGLNADAVFLCEQMDILIKGDRDSLAQLLPQLHNPQGKIAKLIQEAREAQNDVVKFQDAIKSLLTYVQEHAIRNTADAVLIPYRYIVPFNAIFNRSLQNHSSYYTDIGLIWLFVLVLLLGAMIYALIMRKGNSLLLILITLIGWAIRWTIAAGILRYGLGLIIWSIMVVVDFFHSGETDESYQTKTSFYGLFALLVLLMLLQLVLNLIRIASQASDGPFGQYKAGVGKVIEIDNSFRQFEKVKIGFNAQDLFNLQFGQYSPFLAIEKNRADDEGVWIAGTYLPYFLHNQKNVKMDNLLTNLWEEMSDYNSCKTYHRLKKRKMKYFVIDPNIGTVGRVGQGNESLFHRFFAKLNADESKILTPGTISMLIQLYQDGYLDLTYTNNIGAKYAFTLSDETLKEEFGDLTQEEILLLRAKLAVAKFFIDKNDTELFSHILSLLEKRMKTPEGIEDLANLLNKQIDGKKLLKLGSQLHEKSVLTSLTQDEKSILSVFLPLISGKINPERLLGTVQQSLLGSSQLIVLELK